MHGRRRSGSGRAEHHGQRGAAVPGRGGHRRHSLAALGPVSQRAAVGSAMTGWPGQPVIYEINTAVWLDELSRAAGRPVTLASVAAADWDAAVPGGVDAVWLMGVWGRSPAGLLLMTNQVFARTWGGRTGPPPDADFWPSVLGALRARHPETVMIAEAYWDMEWVLQQQGFNFCYDKRLYDRIIGQDASAVRDHLRADLSYQSRLVRFLENHDEPRIASCLPGDPERAAAVAVATLPGATLWHEGQFEGRRVRPPVFLSRRPDEVPDLELAGWYRRLLAAVAGHHVRAGTWRLLGWRLARQPVLRQPGRLVLGR